MRLRMGRSLVPVHSSQPTPTPPRFQEIAGGQAAPTGADALVPRTGNEMMMLDGIGRGAGFL